MGEGCEGAEQTLPCPRTSPEGALKAGTLLPGAGDDITPKPARFAGMTAKLLAGNPALGTGSVFPRTMDVQAWQVEQLFL